MLRLLRLEIQDFGPFRDRQTLEFSRDPGVVIVYGENMRGKTSLLNCIRFALFGNIISRGSRELGFHSVGNWESAAEGHFGFSVVLTFDYGGRVFELTRSCVPRVAAPTSDSDYTLQRFLKRDGTILGPADADRELARIMPEQVSRFFLFDGELLQQYEELLRDESDMGRKIKDAIEQVLGVPILTNARADLREGHRSAQRKESVAAQRDQRTRELGTVLATLVDQRRHQEAEIERLQRERSVLEDRRLSLETSLRKNEKVAGLLDERDKVRKDIQTLVARQTEWSERRNELLEGAWRGLLGRKARRVLADVESRKAEIHAKAIEKEIGARLREQIADALSGGPCPVCTQPIDSSAITHLRTLAETLPQRATDTSTREILTQLDLVAIRLQQFQHSDITERLRDLSRDIDDLAVDLATKQDRETELGDQVRDYDQSAIRKDRSAYETALKEMSVVEEGIASQRAAIVDLDVRIGRVETELARAGGADLSRERRCTSLFGDLASLMNDAVSVFRDDLRTRVEADATDLFRRLTTEPDYIGLRINANYGLTILHQDGREIPVRSAGAEHIVALSLMGALQRNAPLRGPIIMDSPFGRLDELHTTKVIQALPTMADQVILLVHEHELHPKLARDHLHGALQKEYRLERRTARHTIIESYAEGTLQ